MAKGAAHKTPTVHVVFDTNVLFTQAEDRLLNDRVSGFIKSEISKLGVPIVWHLPHVVRGERKRQMIEKGAAVFRPLEKLEKLLGIKVDITPEFLALKVEDIIDREMSDHTIQELSLDTKRVDWEKLIRISVERTPPFSAGNEKGFKDAIILESLCQLVENKPKTPTSCRVVFVCEDELLRETAKSRLISRSNFRAVATLDEAQTIINAIASDITQDVIDNIISKARDLFFVKDKTDTLYYKWSVGEKLFSKSMMSRVPEPGFRVTSKTPYIGTTTFIAKQGQTLTLSTEITVQVKAVKEIILPHTVPNVLSEPPGILGSATSTTSSSGLLAAVAAELARHNRDEDNVNALLYPHLYRASTFPQTETITRTGKHRMAVVWSATFTTHGNLTKPTFMHLDELGSAWDSV